MTYWRVMALVMCSVTDKNMPVMLAVLLPQKNGKNVLVFPNYAKKCAGTIDKRLITEVTERVLGIFITSTNLP